MGKDYSEKLNSLRERKDPEKLIGRIYYHASPVQDIKKFRYSEDTSGNGKGEVVFGTKHPAFAAAFGVKWNDSNARLVVISKKDEIPTEDNFEAVELKITGDIDLTKPCSMYKLKGIFKPLRYKGDIEAYTNDPVEILSEEKFSSYEDMAKAYGLVIKNVGEKHILNQLKDKKTTNFEKKAGVPMKLSEKRQQRLEKIAFDLPSLLGAAVPASILGAGLFAANHSKGDLYGEAFSAGTPDVEEISSAIAESAPYEVAADGTMRRDTDSIYRDIIGTRPRSVNALDEKAIHERANMTPDEAELYYHGQGSGGPIGLGALLGLSAGAIGGGIAARKAESLIPLGATIGGMAGLLGGVGIGATISNNANYKKLDDKYGAENAKAIIEAATRKYFEGANQYFNDKLSEIGCKLSDDDMKIVEAYFVEAGMVPDIASLKRQAEANTRYIVQKQAMLSVMGDIEKMAFELLEPIEKVALVGAIGKKLTGFADDFTGKAVKGIRSNMDNISAPHLEKIKGIDQEILKNKGYMKENADVWRDMERAGSPENDIWGRNISDLRSENWAHEVARDMEQSNLDKALGSLPGELEDATARSHNARLATGIGVAGAGAAAFDANRVKQEKQAMYAAMNDVEKLAFDMLEPIEKEAFLGSVKKNLAQYADNLTGSTVKKQTANFGKSMEVGKDYLGDISNSQRDKRLLFAQNNSIFETNPYMDPDAFAREQSIIQEEMLSNEARRQRIVDSMERQKNTLGDSVSAMNKTRAATGGAALGIGVGAIPIAKKEKPSPEEKLAFEQCLFPMEKVAFSMLSEIEKEAFIGAAFKGGLKTLGSAFKNDGAKAAAGVAKGLGKDMYGAIPKGIKTDLGTVGKAIGNAGKGLGEFAKDVTGINVRAAKKKMLGGYDVGPLPQVNLKPGSAPESAVKSGQKMYTDAKAKQMNATAKAVGIGGLATVAYGKGNSDGYTEGANADILDDIESKRYT